MLQLSPLSLSQCLSLILRKLKSHELNDTDNEKMTALHWSAYNNTSEIVKLLMKAVGTDLSYEVGY